MADGKLNLRPDLGKTREARFWEKIDRADSSGCWVWTRSLTCGYGQFIVMNGKRGLPLRAHRVAWEMLRGPIPHGYDVDHLCHTRERDSCAGGVGCPHRRCCNPDHLELVTNEENIRRGNWPSAVNARKTHCDHGHEFTEANTYHPPKRPHVRQCRVCMAKRTAATNAAARARRAAA